MEEFALGAAISYEIGAARSNLSILSGMNISCDEFFATFGQSINELILRHRQDLEKKRKLAPQQSESKQRWVDGTPEYSFYICELRKLFPDALFIHILRNVRDVVRSMLNFHRVAGIHLVANEREAYTYWLRTVKACVQAEQAYGPDVVRRLPYAELIDTPESSLRSLLDFVGESYSPKCLEPLAKRMNSSNVPVDFELEHSETDVKLVEKATALFRELQERRQSKEASPAVADALQIEFEERVRRRVALHRG
jgi:hypothetical protein